MTRGEHLFQAHWLFKITKKRNQMYNLYLCSDRNNACTRVPIHFSENLKMKNGNFSSFSFFIFAEN